MTGGFLQRIRKFPDHTERPGNLPRYMILKTLLLILIQFDPMGLLGWFVISISFCAREGTADRFQCDAVANHGRREPQ